MRWLKRQEPPLEETLERTVADVLASCPASTGTGARRCATVHAPTVVGLLRPRSVGTGPTPPPCTEKGRRDERHGQPP